MPAVVQANCPGCKKTLRIPAAWVHQQIRCKHCGMVMQAEQPARTAKSVPVVAAKRAPARQVSPPSAPFLEFADDLDQPRTPRRRKKGQSIWPLAVLAVVLTAIAGVGAYRTFAPAPAAAAPQEEEAAASASAGDEPAKPASTAKRTATKPKDKTEPSEEDHVDAVAVAAANKVRFPRRALVVAVHNYLYANPVGPGDATRKVSDLMRSLPNGLNIPVDQIGYLSDAPAKGPARPPLKSVIEETVASFLNTSRAQDRVVLMFVGHGVQIGEEAYLVPIEGELDAAATLIPIKWLYEQLGRCKARQKVLVLDVCRFSPTVGLERPGGEPMDAKFEAALKKVPPGVQVLSACSAGQRSYETEDLSGGVFVGKLQTALNDAATSKIKLQDQLKKPDDLLPIERLTKAVQDSMQRALTPYKLEQTCWLAGKASEGGAAYDATEAPAPTPALADPPHLGGKKKPEIEAYEKRIKGLLDDVLTPPVKSSQIDSGLNFAVLPAFTEKKLAEYDANAGEDSDLRKMVHKVQGMLYAISTTTPPARVAPAVQAAKTELKGNLSVLKGYYAVPADEAKFKVMVTEDERHVAPILMRLTEAHKQMLAVGEHLDAEPKRWQANYQYMLARLEAEIAYLWEYQSMLGRIKTELPPRDPQLHNGWRLASTATLTGDTTGKKMATASRKLLDKIIKDHPGTPWEVLAKREKLTALGLDWKAAR